MIREGSYTSETGNVLDGTQFQQVATSMQFKIRAKGIAAAPTPDGTDTFVKADSDWFATLTIGAVTLSNVVMNQTTDFLLFLSKAASSVSEDSPTAQAGGVQLSDCDTIFEGLIQPGSLSLKFTGAPTNGKVLWDITAY